MKLKQEIFWKRWKTWLWVGLALISLAGSFSSWFSSVVQAEEESEMEGRIGGGIVPSTPPDFDWNLLNSDGLDLKNYTEVNENTPVPLTGGAFDRTQRQYMLFFGSMKVAMHWSYSTQSFEVPKQTIVYLPLNSPSYPYFPIQAMGLTGYARKPPLANNPTIAPAFAYDYNYQGTPQSASNPNNLAYSGQGFDIGILKNGKTAGMINPRGGLQTQIISNVIKKQYIKQNELISYGFLHMSVEAIRLGAPEYLPVRVREHVVNFSTGRIRFDITTCNTTNSPLTILPLYGIHVDIMGAHRHSLLLPNGEDGVYFDQSGGAEYFSQDKIPTRIYFYKGKDYPENNGPKYYQTGNYSTMSGVVVGTWNDIDKNSFSKTNPSIDQFDANHPLGKGQADVPSGSGAYPLGHPVFAYRWDPIDIQAGQTATFAMDLSVEEPGPVTPIVSKSFKNLTATDKKNHVGDTLEFSLALGNHGENVAWENVTVKDVLPEHLKIDSSSFKLEQPNGTETSLPASIYNTGNRTLTAGPYTVKVNDSYKIKFKAEITGNGGETIVNKMAASDKVGQIGEVTSEVEIPVEKVPKANLVVKFMNGSTQLNAPITINDVVGKKINLSTNEKVKPILDKLLKDYNFTSKPDDTAVPIKDGGSEFVYQFMPKIASLKVYFKLGNQTIDPTTGMLTASDAYLPFEGKVGEKFDLSKDSSITAALGRIDQYYDLETAPGPIVTIDPSLKQVVYQFKQGKGTWYVKYLEKGTNKVLGKEYTVALDAGSEYNMGNDPNVKSMLEEIKNKHYTLADINGDTKFLVTKKGGTITYYFEADKGVLNVYFKDSDNNSIDPTTGAVTTAPKPITTNGKIYDTIDLQKQSTIASALKALDQYFDIDSEQTPDQKVTLTQPSQDFTYVLNRAKAPWTIRFLKDGTNKQLRKNLVLSRSTGWNWSVDKDKGIQDALKEINDQYYQVVRTEGDKNVQLTKQGATFTYYFKADEGTLNVYFKDSAGKDINPETGAVISSPKSIAIKGKIHDTIDLPKQPTIASALKVLDQYFDIDPDKTPDQKVSLTQPSQDFTYVLNRTKAPWTIHFLEDGTNNQLRKDLVLSRSTGWNWNVNKDKGIQDALKEMNDQYYHVVRTEGIENVQLTKDGATFTYYFQAELGTVKVRFQNVKGEELSDPVEVAGRISSTVSLADDATVKAKLDELAKLGYTTTKNPQVKIEETETEYIFVLSDGDFSLKSAPEMLEFSDYHTGVYGKVTATNPDWADHPLVVTDTRAHPEGWEVKVQMTQDLTSQADQDFSLKNALYYKRDDSKTPLSKGSGVVVVYDNKADKKTGNVDISKLEWKDKGNGFSIELKDSQYRKLGDYNAKLLYTLEETP